MNKILYHYCLLCIFLFSCKSENAIDGFYCNPGDALPNSILDLNKDTIIDIVIINGEEVSGHNFSFNFEDGMEYTISSAKHDPVTIKFIDVKEFICNLNVYLSKNNDNDDHEQGDTSFHLGKLSYCTDSTTEELFIHVQQRRTLRSDLDICDTLKLSEFEVDGKMNRQNSYTIEYDWNNDLDGFGSDDSKVVIQFRNLIDDSTKIDIALAGLIPGKEPTCYGK